MLEMTEVCLARNKSRSKNGREIGFMPRKLFTESKGKSKLEPCWWVIRPTDMVFKFPPLVTFCKEEIGINQANEYSYTMNSITI